MLEESEFSGESDIEWLSGLESRLKELVRTPLFSRSGTVIVNEEQSLLAVESLKIVWTDRLARKK